MAAKADSGDQKQKVVRHFLLNSPPGQIKDVLANCKRLIQGHSDGAGGLPEGFVKGVCAEYNEARRMTVSLIGGGVGIICQESKLSDDSYLDPRGEGRIFVVDHERLVCTACRKAAGDPLDPRGELTSRAKEYREHIEKKLDKYIESHYRAGQVGAQAFVVDGPCATIEVSVVISVTNQKLRNFWSASWSSNYHMKFMPNGRPDKLIGKIEIFGHYFEDGNVQMKNVKDVKVEVDVKGKADVFADRFVDAVANAESNVQTALEDFFITFGESTFKCLRRTFPLSMEKFDWHPQRHALVKDMKGIEGV
eukprot:gnl/MRDRNA2_/MRDRNA2_84694_c0_seq3.p1 gnl/MRDRNA2_/MRDRNA2_84694_c0~~gnl/MRDRNA2_/MRDRNA2_84694_c0_seq3.p1  ORF type:complete len:329 (+),score=68.23 gnl/MRDRNA2_/MRDRNA2_84694_c0_seq3:69-989(+)